MLVPDRPSGEIHAERSARLFRSLCLRSDFFRLYPTTNDENTQYFKISFRIVRFKVTSGYVCVATNLSEEDFPPDLLRDLYRLRWDEESSFRELKYTIGLVNFHSRIKELILQEIYARLILYNFCELIVSHTVVQTRRETKHSYKINFATAVNICKEYLSICVAHFYDFLTFETVGGKHR